MKKTLLIVSCALMALVLVGCQSGKSPAVKTVTTTEEAAAGPQFAWDRDLRPMVAVPKRSAAEAKSQVEVAAEERTPSKGPERQTSVAAPAAPISEVVTASVEPMERVGPAAMRPVGRQAPTAGADLVTLREQGAQLTLVYPRPDYALFQVDKIMPSEVRVSKPFSYVIKITNLTEMMITDLVMTEDLPKGFQFAGADPTAELNGSKLVWGIESLGPHVSRQMTISGTATETVRLDYCTSITHTARACASVNVVQPKLELVKTIPADAVLCEPISVEYTVANAGTGQAENVQIVDELPAGLQTADGKAKVVLEAGTLAAGESRHFSIKLRAAKTGAYSSKAVATSAAGLTAESAIGTTTVRQPMLAITKTGPLRQYLGRPVTYEITVTNKGDGSAKEVVLEDVVPAGVTSTEASAGAKLTGSRLVWEIGTLEPNASRTMRVSYQTTKAEDLMSSASASGYCIEPVTASARTVVTGVAALRLEVVDLDDPVQVGGSATYVITVTNQGSAADANIRISCALEDRLAFVSSAGVTPGSIMGRTVSFAPLRSLEPKAKATWRVVVRGVRAGDVRFKVTMNSDQLALPVEQTEATLIYE